MIVLGTAGHIDHGKSAIVRRLTGTDPDRLPEEQSRGMTIDLGFAFYDTSGGETVGLVDVPGHEKFVKNMIAGAGGIEGVMLVVAADDGWMPQSDEHFQIVRLLGVSNGLIVINKIDLVEPDWVDLLKADIREKVAGSFLAEAPMFAVSATTGAGFDELRSYLDTIPEQYTAQRSRRYARLPIDRAFHRPGMGAVVTGTLKGQPLEVGQAVRVWPAGAQAKIRSLQSQNEARPEAQPGDRTAVSFTGLDRTDLGRGGVVTDIDDLDYFDQHPVLALRVELLPTASVELTDRRELVLLLGTTETAGDIRLLSPGPIRPGDTGVVFFRPRESMFALVGDHAIIRLPTPMVTLGGARVLDHLAGYPRKKHHARFIYLLERNPEALSSVIHSELVKSVLSPARGFLKNSDYLPELVSQQVDSMLASGAVQNINNMLCLPERLETAMENLLTRIKAELDRQSHLRGLTLKRLVEMSDYTESTTRTLVNHMVGQKRLARIEDVYRPAGAAAELKGMIKEAHDTLVAELEREPLAPPSLSDLATRGKQYQQAIRYMIDTGEVHKCGSDFLFLFKTWQDFVTFIARRLKETDELAVGDLRTAFGLTRKYAIPILEECDRLGLTRRSGDVRTTGDKFESSFADL